MEDMDKVASDKFLLVVNKKTIFNNIEQDNTFS